MAAWAALVTLAAVATLALLVNACHRPARARPKVVTTIFPVYDLTRRIAGADADVTMLVPPLLSPHLYNPSPVDAQHATGASLAVMVGLDFDSWLTPVMAQVSPTARLLKLADRVPTLPRVPAVDEETNEKPRHTSRGPVGDDSQGLDTIDVHVWLDPQRALLMARAISDELCRVDPGHAAAYRERSLAVTQSLEALDRELDTRTAGLARKSFVTLHDAFRYFAARYHLEVVAAVEPHPGVKPKIRYEQLVLARLRQRGAAAVFGEPQLDSQPAKTVASAAQVPYGVLDPLGGTPGVDSYESLLRYDTDVLERTLAAASSTPAPGPSVTPPPSAP